MTRATLHPSLRQRFVRSVFQKTPGILLVGPIDSSTRALSILWMGGSVCTILARGLEPKLATRPPPPKLLTCATENCTKLHFLARHLQPTSFKQHLFYWCELRSFAKKSSIILLGHGGPSIPARFFHPHCRPAGT